MTSAISTSSDAEANVNTRNSSSMFHQYEIVVTAVTPTFPRLKMKIWTFRDEIWTFRDEFYDADLVS